MEDRHPERARSPRRALACLLALALSAAPGCEVVDVIDNIGKDAKAVAKKEEPQPAAAALPDQGNPRAKLEAYYKSTRTDDGREDDPDDPIVQCKTGGSVLFIRKHDCEMRRGRVLS